MKRSVAILLSALLIGVMACETEKRAPLGPVAVDASTTTETMTTTHSVTPEVVAESIDAEVSVPVASTSNVIQYTPTKIQREGQAKVVREVNPTVEPFQLSEQESALQEAAQASRRRPAQKPLQSIVAATAGDIIDFYEPVESGFQRGRRFYSVPIGYNPFETRSVLVLTTHPLRPWDYTYPAEWVESWYAEIGVDAQKRWPVSVFAKKPNSHGLLKIAEIQVPARKVTVTVDLTLLDVQKGDLLVIEASNGLLEVNDTEWPHALAYPSLQISGDSQILAVSRW